MSDLTRKFKFFVKDLNITKDTKVNESPNQQYFNVYTQDIVGLMNIYIILDFDAQSNSQFNGSIENQIFSTFNFHVNKSCKQHQSQGSFTEQQKDEFDIEVINCIKICKEKISELQVMLKQQTSFLASQNKTLTQKRLIIKREYAHKEIAIGCLMQTLNKVMSKFKEFKTFRQKQKERVQKLTKYKGSGQKKGQSKNSKQKLPDSDIIELQNNNPDTENPQLVSENKMLLIRFNDNMEEIIRTQDQIKEISEIISKMSETLQRQELTTDQILDDAKTSLHHIEHANRNLIDATKLNEKLGFCWAFLYFGMAFFLIFYDFINS